nr:hypothetical protein [uncultured Desulfobulbus sp.]
MVTEKETQVKDVFAFYVDYVKPLYCEIEATNNALPVELLFEIHAAFDHLRRIYVDNHPESQEAQKACAHLKRGALDAYKLKLKYFNRDVTKLNRVDLTLIDNGRFYSEYQRDRLNIRQLGTQARLSEGQEGPDEAFQLWDQTSISINDFLEKYLKDNQSIDWAKKRTVYLWCKTTWISLVVGFVAGIASTYVFSLFTRCQ